MSQTRKVTDDQILSAYRETNSVWKAGKKLGICGQSVYERLQVLGEDCSVAWTAYEIDILKSAYADGRVNLRNIANTIGRTKASVACKAAELNLTARRGKARQSVEACAAMSVRAKLQISANGHPRGMLGKTHSETTKMVISEKGLGRTVPPEQTMRMMKTKVARYGSVAPKIEGSPRSWKSGWRNIGGCRIYARSRWEANYARFLQFLMDKSEIVRWEHEPETFWFDKIKRGVRSYLPDFRVTQPSGAIEYHEVKGWMDARSKTKLKRMKKYHPHIYIRVIDANWFKANGKKMKAIIEGWE